MNIPLRVLIVEDSKADAALLIREVRHGGYNPVYERVDTAGAMDAALEEQCWDIVISDYVMPHFSGLAALKLLQEKDIDLPFIIVSGQIGEATAVEAMKAGAHDYIVKGNLARLIPAVQRELREAEGRRARKQAERQRDQLLAEVQAARDELEDRVKVRTAELEKANEELQREMAERKRGEQERERLLDHVRRINEQLILNNIESRELAELADRRAAELDTIISSVADGLVIYGQGGEIVRMNPAAERMLGYGAEESARSFADRVGLCRIETLDGKPLPPEEAPAMRALRGEMVRGFVMVLHRDDGPIWVSASASPLCSPDGTILGAVSTFTDITRIQELQKEREDFIHTISHDLRSPLTVILGQAQVAGRLADNVDKVRNSAKAIFTSAKRMNTMIQDLVDSARRDAGELRLNKQPVDLDQFMSELLDRTKGVMAVDRIKVEIPSDLPPVDADPDRLERILVNLLSNALKYSGATTEVRVKAEKADGKVIVSVADQGVGIAPEDLPHLFERFYRAKGAEKAEGLGLGLYITKMLVEVHGGRIWVESEQDDGSTFYFTLPLA